MPGAHARSPRSAGRRPRLLAPSSPGGHPSGVGWWQPPKRRPAAASSDETARHRVLDPAGLRATAPAPSPDHEQGPDREPGPGHEPGRPGEPAPDLSDAQRRARLCHRICRGALGSVGAAVLALMLTFTLGYLFFPMPSPDDAVNNQVALVSFADGSQLSRLVAEEGNRTKVPIEQVPAHVREAVLAAEDRSFYSNPGFDVTGILRAVWNQLRGGAGGGSTITQQYVKQTLVGDERTLWRKYKEVVLAVKISQEHTKDEILGDYLNAIYFGRGAYGIQAAGQAYFGKSVQDLTPSEGALLAGLIQSPSRWDPAVSPERAVQRWNFVLDGMAAQGWLDRGTRASALFPPTVPRRPSTGGAPSDDRGHIVTAVTAELEELGISEQDLTQDGLRITTTIDPRRQQQAVDAAHDSLDGQPGNLRSAMVAIDPGTGAVLAYYGGDNGLGLDYARTQRLAGSTFKPFVVLAGLLRDPPVGLGETFDGTALRGLRNAAGADCERCDLKQAMTVSNNVVFSTLARQVGPEAVAAAARAAGITAPLEDPNEGIALGNKEVSAFDLASAYATLAAGGVWHAPHLVTSVVTAEGRVLYQADNQGEQRFPERVARNVTETMLGVAKRDGLALPGGRPVAAKTGTVESHYEGQNNDAWMAGFTPGLSSSVWMGTDMNAPIKTSTGKPIVGASLPGDVWREFMSGALDDEPVQQFAPFRPIGEAPADPSPAGSREPAGSPPTTIAEGAATPTPEPGSPGALPSGTPPPGTEAPGGDGPDPTDNGTDGTAGTDRDRTDRDDVDRDEPDPDATPPPAGPAGGADCSEDPCG